MLELGVSGGNEQVDRKAGFLQLGIVEGHASGGIEIFIRKGSGGHEEVSEVFPSDERVNIGVSSGLLIEGEGDGEEVESDAGRAMQGRGIDREPGHIEFMGGTGAGEVDSGEGDFSRELSARHGSEIPFLLGCVRQPAAGLVVVRGLELALKKQPPGQRAKRRDERLSRMGLAAVGVPGGKALFCRAFDCLGGLVLIEKGVARGCQKKGLRPGPTGANALKERGSSGRAGTPAGGGRKETDGGFIHRTEDSVTICGCERKAGGGKRRMNDFAERHLVERGGSPLCRGSVFVSVGASVEEGDGFGADFDGELFDFDFDVFLAGRDFDGLLVFAGDEFALDKDMSALY